MIMMIPGYLSGMMLLLLVAMMSPMCSGHDRVELLNHITDNYATKGYIRPVFDSSTVTNVTLRVLFHHLINMDTRRQQFTISIWVKQTWRDEFLAWNASEFGGIESLYVPLSIIWKPDITLYTNVDPEFIRYQGDRLALLTFDGGVMWISPAIITSYCRISVHLFPFDVQACEMNFASWSYTDLQIKLFPEVSRLAAQDRYLENGVWDLTSVTVRNRTMWYSCCLEDFSEVVYRLTFQRRAEFYVIHLILPCIFLSALSLLVFYLPTDCGEKLTLSITNLLALVVYQQIIAEHIPPTGDDSPLIDTYFLVLIVMVCISVACTVFVIHIAGNTHPVPPTMKRLFLDILQKILWPNRRKDVMTFDVNPIENEQQTVTAEESSLTRPGHIEMYNGGHGSTCSKGFHVGSTKSRKNTYCNKYMETTTRDTKVIVSDWKDMARVLDRCLLIILLIFALVTTLVMFLKIYLSANDYRNAISDHDGIELIQH